MGLYWICICTQIAYVLPDVMPDCARLTDNTSDEMVVSYVNHIC